MLYISTRNNCAPVTAPQAIELGMVPDGGLFVPESVPEAGGDVRGCATYQETAKKILAPYLPEFAGADLDRCVSCAYNRDTFGTDAIVNVVPLDPDRSIMELWHGPTAAFKDVALQIMPHFLAASKRITHNSSHTVILVATSGDTGKAALEGFKDCAGISIIVFYPHQGVSEIQELQMTTTGGGNTGVVAVRGNFDHCQTGVKQILGSKTLRGQLRKKGFEFSSANSINWGRLCPQIVYYWTSYRALVAQSVIRDGEPVNLCVPTGNFGNILAAYYALRMGLPVAKLICASNRNNVLADFFASGRYDSNRAFHRTMSPSMDILISSNLERFLFEVTGHDAAAVNGWSAALAEFGLFSVDEKTKGDLNLFLSSGWVDEAEVSAAIRDVFKKTGYVLDTHTAVAVALSNRVDTGGRHTIIASTASPYKFSQDVLSAVSGETAADEFSAIERIAALSGMPVHRAVAGLRDRPVRHTRVIERGDMQKTVLDIMSQISK
jgi:threonine synthase